MLKLYDFNVGKQATKKKTTLQDEKLFTLVCTITKNMPIKLQQ